MMAWREGNDKVDERLQELAVSAYLEVTGLFI